jgi:hypothetical protein
MVPVTIVTWAYKPTYNWGGPHCGHQCAQSSVQESDHHLWPPKMDPATGRHQIFGLLISFDLQKLGGYQNGKLRIYKMGKMMGIHYTMVLHYH